MEVVQRLLSDFRHMTPDLFFFWGQGLDFLGCFGECAAQRLEQTNPQPKQERQNAQGCTAAPSARARSMKPFIAVSFVMDSASGLESSGSKGVSKRQMLTVTGSDAGPADLRGDHAGHRESSSSEPRGAASWLDRFLVKRRLLLHGVQCPRPKQLGPHYVGVKSPHIVIRSEVAVAHTHTHTHTGHVEGNVESTTRKTVMQPSRFLHQDLNRCFCEAPACQIPEEFFRNPKPKP